MAVHPRDASTLGVRRLSMEGWKIGVVVGVMTLAGVVVGATCFGTQ
jgi:hypothetical protein